MNPKLPQAIALYFEAVNRHESKNLTDCLADDIKIIDAGEEDVISGIDAVKKWVVEIGTESNLAFDVVKVGAEGQKIVVDAMVNGDFPGSPQLFLYHFTMRGNLISSVEIFPG